MRGMILVNPTDQILHCCGFIRIVSCMFQWWCVLHSIKLLAIEQVSRVLAGVAELVFCYGPNKFVSDIRCVWCPFLSMQA